MITGFEIRYILWSISLLIINTWTAFISFTTPALFTSNQQMEKHVIIILQKEKHDSNDIILSPKLKYFRKAVSP
jgi:hypothetical protein